MDDELSDSSGTDDDLPPSNRNRLQSRGHSLGNGRSGAVGSSLAPKMNTDMETQIHNIEQEAYTSVLRAFKAQSDAITWEQESLITELRKELRVSDEEHRELLSRVNDDETIRRIREWRKASGYQPGMPSTSRPAHDVMPTPTASAPCKKQKASQSVASLSIGAPSPALHPTVHASMTTMNPGSRSKRLKSFPSADFSEKEQANSRGSSGAFMRNKLAAASGCDPLIGRKVWSRWPEDNNFYEAVIRDYDPIEGRHALVYDSKTADETWEWVNLKEMPPEDIRWDDDDDPGICHRGGHPGPGPGRGNKKFSSHGGADPGAGRGRGTPKSRKDFPSANNGMVGKTAGYIEILHTDTLIKKVEKVFSANRPDPAEVEKAKKVLKEHEQSLVDAITRLEGASDAIGPGHILPQSRSMHQVC